MFIVSEEVVALNDIQESNIRGFVVVKCFIFSNFQLRIDYRALVTSKNNPTLVWSFPGMNNATHSEL